MIVTDLWPRAARAATLLGAAAAHGARMREYRYVAISGVSDDAQRIALVPSAGAVLRLVAAPGTCVYEYDWMPDGRGFVATGAQGNGGNNWWVATLGAVDIHSGALGIIAAPKMQVSLPRVSPDGRTVAFVGGLMSDFGSVGGNVFTVPLDVTPDYAGSFNGLAWKGNGLLASSLQGSEMAVVAIDPQARSARTLWMSARGYYVFQPNPRGSYGQGLAFTMANRRDFGGGAWRDILAGIDAVLREAPADGERLGLMSHS